MATTRGDGLAIMLRMAKLRLYLPEWREFRNDMTQDQLAERIGMSKASISRIESGKQSWNDDFLEAAAVALNCTPADLLIRDPRKGDSLYSIADQVPPERHTEAAEVLRVFTRRAANGR